MANSTWTTSLKSTITPIKFFLSKYSIKVRTDQYQDFVTLLKPNNESKVLDVGVSSDETLKDSNMFEKLYPYPRNLTAATIEEADKLQQIYKKIHVKQIIPGGKFPFKNKSFDIVVSWATLEHVGGYKEQENFINELLRVGKKVFLTTPYRGCIYEPHTGLFFLHWLPLSVFRKVCKIFGKELWASEKILNPLYPQDLKKMKLVKKIKIKIYYMFHILPTHLIITSI